MAASMREAPMKSCAIRSTVLHAPEPSGHMRDPSFPISIRALERHPDYREAARACPDLADPQVPPLNEHARCNVVLVHGGLSNGLANFGDTLIGGPAPLLRPGPGFNVFRFEHDTWLPVEENVRELTALVRRKLRGERLLFIGFSRGGVVAARTAARLRELGAIAEPAHPGSHGDVAVMTFGTPHRGFRTGDLGWHVPRVCYCLQYAVSTAILHLPARSRLAIFISSLQRLSRLPPGIADIRTRNPELEAFIGSAAGRWIEPRLQAYGGSPAEPAWLPRWLRVLRSRPVPGIGDGAVSLSSSTAYGHVRNEVRGCGHDDYFSRAEIRRAILRCLGPINPFGATGPAASPAAA
jgi:pimeloyl-ACP methyl ester carboxylesterase